MESRLGYTETGFFLFNQVASTPLSHFFNLKFLNESY